MEVFSHPFWMEEKPQLRNHLRVIAGHQLSDLLPTGRSRGLIELAHFLKIAQIALRRKSAEETSGPLRWIAERMGDPRRDADECGKPGSTVFSDTSRSSIR